MAGDDAKLLTLDQVRPQLPPGVPPLYRLLDDGTLPSVKVGTRRFVRATDLERYLAGLDPAVRKSTPGKDRPWSTGRDRPDRPTRAR